MASAVPVSGKAYFATPNPKPAKSAPPTTKPSRPDRCLASGGAGRGTSGSTPSVVSPKRSGSCKTTGSVASTASKAPSSSVDFAFSASAMAGSLPCDCGEYAPPDYLNLTGQTHSSALQFRQKQGNNVNHRCCIRLLCYFNLGTRFARCKRYFIAHRGNKQRGIYRNSRQSGSE